jgi:hypothetical protein
MNLRANISFQLDTVAPRDAVSINPCFFGDDPQALADRLKANLLAALNVGAATPFTIRVYDIEKAPPSYPLATAGNTATPRVSGNPRELALCLSYYSTWNRKYYRGRLYIPATFLGGATGLRPTTTQITNALNWKNALTTGLPSGTNWIIWSKVLKKASGVTNCWVDDEWDIIRSRGLRGETRQLATVP